MKIKSQRIGGFTLVELLVVIAIIGVLIALLLPAIQAAREAGRCAQCANNLHQIGVALHNYHQAMNHLPYGTDFAGFYGPNPTNKYGTWTIFILPYLELKNAYSQFKLNKPLPDPANADAVTMKISVYICPSDPLASRPILKNRGDADYGGNPIQSLGLWYPACIGPTHPDNCPFCPNPTPGPKNWCCQGWNWGTSNPPANAVGMFGRYPKAYKFKDVTDGTSNTIMAAETRPGDCIFNGAFCPNFPVASTSIPLNTFLSDHGIKGTDDPSSGLLWAKTSGYKSYHPGGANFLMGDGSLHFFVSSIDFQLYNALGTRAGREIDAMGKIQEYVQ
jgi:prepilin-type N-terminal cleavage/methylation domain-containing protein/prepilin-type processing-associated H-X9-DG protein